MVRELLIGRYFQDSQSHSQLDEILDGTCKRWDYMLRIAGLDLAQLPPPLFLPGHDRPDRPDRPQAAGESEASL